MARVRVKICGITGVEDARVAARAGADAIGLIFADSPRQVTPAEATRIVAALPPWVSAVGVFVNEDVRRVAEIARRARLSVVQLHGDESPDDVRAIAEEFKVIRAFRVGKLADLEATLDYLEACRPDAVLIDARSEKAYGGTGETAPWDLVVAAREAMWPLVLGGGLTPENVAEAIRTVGPFGVEGNSGVEIEPGRKDPERVRAFIEAARRMDIHYPENGESEHEQ